MAESYGRRAAMDFDMTYIRIMQDTLNKKEQVLQDILAVTKRQAQCMKEEAAVQTEELDRCMDLKSDYLKTLNQLDDGFEKLYQKVRAKFQSSPEAYAGEVPAMQQSISRIMDLSISIQALERKNKQAMERYFMRHRKNIQSYKSSQQKVNQYYNHMAKFNPHQSYFMDKKK